jgi:hypothetical protein
MGMTERLKNIKPPRTLGLYPTPEWATAELLQRLPLESGDVILDPASGDSAIAKVIKEFSSRLCVVTNDIDSHRQADFHLDMTLRESWKWIERSTGGFDWAIGNPPLHSAPPPGEKTGRPIVDFFVQMGYQHARKGIVFLLRKSFTEPVGNRRVWLQTSTHEQFLELRLEPIRFKGKRRSAESARDWYGWRHGHTGGFVPEYIWSTP